MAGTENYITFRSCPLENDDRTKTLVKIESDYMDKLGIKDGDIVKVSGNCSAMAFCFSLNKDELERAKSQDPQIEYLNPDHVETEYPIIIMSGLIHSNACPSRRLRLVKLERIPPGEPKSMIPEAYMLTLGTMKFVENSMPGYRQH